MLHVQHRGRRREPRDARRPAGRGRHVYRGTGDVRGRRQLPLATNDFMSFGGDGYPNLVAQLDTPSIMTMDERLDHVPRGEPGDQPSDSGADQLPTGGDLPGRLPRRNRLGLGPAFGPAPSCLEPNRDGERRGAGHERDHVRDDDRAVPERDSVCEPSPSVHQTGTGRFPNWAGSSGFTLGTAARGRGDRRRPRG